MSSLALDFSHGSSKTTLSEPFLAGGKQWPKKT